MATTPVFRTKLLAAPVRPGRERLRGRVEVDETYVGGEEQGVTGRQTETKAILAIGVEVEHPKGFGRVRMQHIADVSKDSLIRFAAGVSPAYAPSARPWWATSAAYASKLSRAIFDE